ILEQVPVDRAQFVKVAGGLDRVGKGEPTCACSSEVSFCGVKIAVRTGTHLIAEDARFGVDIRAWEVSRGHSVRGSVPPARRKCSALLLRRPCPPCPGGSFPGLPLLASAAPGRRPLLELCSESGWQLPSAFSLPAMSSILPVPPHFCWARSGRRNSRRS